ncbi:MAG TPA: hypothetical protein VGS22_28950 [Thermoanaerobaculia bacterium]|nr:hypothetical protein [Thermoanaerobaculia bacterium]
MATKKSTPSVQTTEPPTTQLKSERIQLALASLPGWALGPPRQRVEAFFRLAAVGKTDRFVPFVLAICRQEGSVVEMSVRENLAVRPPRRSRRRDGRRPLGREGAQRVPLGANARRHGGVSGEGGLPRRELAIRRGKRIGRGEVRITL